jgi:hypothetical protein
MTQTKINLHAEIAKRIGVDPELPADQLLGLLDRALTIPDGVTLIDVEALAQLRAEAELGRTHRERGLVEQAIRQGKVPPSSRQTWITLLMHDPNAEQVLASLKPNTIPVKLIGYGKDDEQGSDEQLLRELFPSGT